MKKLKLSAILMIFLGMLTAASLTSCGKQASTESESENTEHPEGESDEHPADSAEHPAGEEHPTDSTSNE